MKPMAAPPAPTWTVVVKAIAYTVLIWILLVAVLSVGYGR